MSGGLMGQFQIVEDFISWPFPLSQPAESTLDHQLVAFMETAHVAGHKPRYNVNAIIAGDDSVRSVLLVFRGVRNGWEPMLCEHNCAVRLGPKFGLSETACVCVRSPFSSAACFATDWLVGKDIDAILSRFHFVGGYPAGVELGST